MADQTLTTFVPQQGDSERQLLMRLAGFASVGSAPPVTLLALTERTATAVAPTLDLKGAKGVVIELRITAGTAGFDLRFGAETYVATQGGGSIGSVDSIVNANTIVRMFIYPGMVEHIATPIPGTQGSISVGLVMGRYLVAFCVHANANPVTYSMTAWPIR